MRQNFQNDVNEGMLIPGTMVPDYSLISTAYFPTESDTGYQIKIFFILLRNYTFNFLRV